MQVNLESKVLVPNEGVSENQLIAIAHQCSQLEELDLARCKDVSDRALIALTTYARNLSSLRLGHCPNITDSGLAFIAMCSNLKKLDISGCKNISGFAIQRLIYQLPQLAELNLASIESYIDILSESMNEIEWVGL